ncbi:DUF1194 domain-containing protein [Thalassobaculum sp.]|uniref:DUF1194 domain-containing protein n=1 Tax=Thalassobaculum sp. TaxID=2022740 RepID=UPI0032EC6C09
MEGRSGIGRLVGSVLLAMAGGAFPDSARAEVPVDLELILAIDSSDSVDGREYALQVGGLAAAFRDPTVHQAIGDGPLGSIAVAVVEWSGRYQQIVQIPWTRLDGAAAAVAFAEQIDRLRRAFDEGVTSISGALDFAAEQFAGNGFVAARRVIDISSDGVQNQGRRIDLAREATLARDVTINALVILNEMPDLEEYFSERVIGGFGAFVIVANDYPDYPEAIRRKLLREIGQTPVSLLDREGGQLAVLPAVGGVAAP